MHNHLLVHISWHSEKMKAHVGFLPFLSFPYLSSLIAIIMTKANQPQIIGKTIPQNEYSEYMVFVGVIIAIVDRPVTIKLELVS